MLDKAYIATKENANQENVTPFRSHRKRQKLVVRTQKGEVFYGTSYDLNRKMPGFHLDLQNVQGESLNRTIQIPFETIKAIFYVKSFDGHFLSGESEATAQPGERPIAVKFTDGEVIIGRPVHGQWSEEPRFYLWPEKQNGNNMMILIERNAVKSIHDARTYLKKQHEEYEAFKASHLKPGMSEEECRGDFAFSKRDYNEALRTYRIVREKETSNPRLIHKLCATRYNLGIRYIRNHDYPQALHCMEQVLKMDPNHAPSREKAAQLRAHLAKHK